MDRKSKKHPAPIIEALEPRMMFSADIFGGAVDNPATDDSLASLLDDTAAVLEKQTSQLNRVQTEAALSESSLAEGDVTSSSEETFPRLELVFVDADTPDYQQLVDDLLSNSDNSLRFEVIVLDNNSDGVEQITSALQGHQGVNAIHLIAHGEDGAVDLGNTQLNNQNFVAYQAQLQSWANYLDTDADILFYGCDLAASENGQTLIDRIATFTGADIAASNDLTGNADLGGDWELEYSAGQIDARVAFSEQVQAMWQGTLSPALWLSTDSNVGPNNDNSPVANGLTSWTEGQVLEFSGTHGVTTSGSLSMVIDFDAFTIGTGDTDQTVDAGALHFVSRDITVGGANGTFDLKAGDVLVSFLQDETIGAAHSSTGADMRVHDQDLLVFRPDTLNDYSAGRFTVLLDDVVSDDLKGVTLIEQNTTIGGTDIAAGSFLLISETSLTKTIDLYVPTGVGAGATTGTTTPLIDLSNLGIEANSLRGIEVIEAATTIGGQSLIKGDVLATLNINDNVSGVGSDGLKVDQNDVFVLRLTSTGEGTTAGTASMFFDGSDVGLDNSPGPESPYALALYNYSQLVVDTVSDVADGNTASIKELLLDKGADGKISLREAILAANNPSNSDVTDVIRFNITDPLVSGVHTIGLGSALPTITDTLIIDGTSEPDFSGTPVIRIDGASAGANVDGLSFSATSDNSIVRGLMVTGFSRDGILVQAGADHLTFTGNWIGTSGAGSTGVGNGDDGIELIGSHATIGGTNANEGNVITNAGDEGINIAGTGVTAHLIQGNYIGLDPDGVSGSGNTDVGIAIISGSGNNIGGTTASARNVISNNFEGIEVNTSNNIFQGNYIGTDASGTLDRGNRSDDGIEIQSSATGNLIGGTQAGAGNLIAFNALDGINIVNGNGNTVLGNQIHSNGDMGIDLGTSGVTSSDANDGDIGANNLQNYPVITAADLTGTNLTLSGILDTDGTNTSYRIEFFGNAIGTQDATNGEARFFLGSTTLTTDVNGDAAFNDVLLSGVALSEGDYVTATATRVDDASQVGTDDQLAYGDTSEFAANVSISSPTNAVPEVTASAGATGYSEQDPATIIDSAITLVDPDGFDGADPSDQFVGVVTISGNYSADDVLGFTNTAKIQGNLVGNQLTLSVISGQTATVAEFETALRSVTIFNGSDTPSELDRTISFSFDDGVDSSNVASKVVQVTAVNDDPVVTLPGNPAQYSAGGGAVSVDAGATVNDVDSLNFDGGGLQVGFAGATGTTDDALSIRNEGTGAGQIGVSGNIVTYEGVEIGKYSGGTGLTRLSIVFNADASTESVQALARNIIYDNYSTTPDTSDRQIRFELSDGDGGNNANVFQTVHFNSDAQISGNTSFTGNEGDLASGALSATDSDGLTDGTYFTVSSQGANGTAEIREASGAWAYTPADPNWFGTDSFIVTVTDDLGGTTEQVVTVTLSPVNDAPIAQDDRVGLSFDGVDDYVVVPHSASLEMTNNLTMEVWINHDGSGTGTQIIVGKEGEYEIGITADTGEIKWAIADTTPTWGWHNTGHFVEPGEWAHIAVTFDGGNGEINTYVNGILVNAFTRTPGAIGDVYTQFDELRIGGRENSTDQRFSGLIDEVRIWEATRTESDIRQTMESLLAGDEAGLVANWRFDEGYGTTVIDFSSFANHGTLGGADAPASVPEWSGYITTETAVLDTAASAINGVLANDIDVDSDPLTATNLDTTNTLGLVTLNPDGSFIYDPNGKFDYLSDGESATDTFSYIAHDGTVGSNPATVTITVIGSNNAPLAADDAYAVGEGSYVSGNVITDDTGLGADSDAEGHTLQVTLVNGGSYTAGTPVTLASGAEVTFQPDGLFTYNTNGKFQYLGAGQTATDKFTYQVSDGNGGLDTAEVSMTVNGTNDAATITVTATDTAVTEDDAGNTTASGTVTISDPDTGEGTLASSTANYGTVTVDGSGNWTYALDN
ncbi:DUF4347 domain-containing protein, partial [Marinobacter sp.]|uniref:DUF4347 domain-containing protein n=1 Tax=Marinobacter sp. TaxID=50741 RepID=UPI002B266E1D